MRRKRMAKAMVSDSSRDFWHEVNCCKIRKQTPAICVDGVLGDDRIVELWAPKLTSCFSKVIELCFRNIWRVPTYI